MKIKKSLFIVTLCSVLIMNGCAAKTDDKSKEKLLEAIKNYNLEKVRQTESISSFDGNEKGVETKTIISNKEMNVYEFTDITKGRAEEKNIQMRLQVLDGESNFFVLDLEEESWTVNKSMEINDTKNDLNRYYDADFPETSDTIIDVEDQGKEEGLQKYKVQVTNKDMKDYVEEVSKAEEVKNMMKEEPRLEKIINDIKKNKKYITVWVDVEKEQPVKMEEDDTLTQNLWHYLSPTGVKGEASKKVAKVTTFKAEGIEEIQIPENLAEEK